MKSTKALISFTELKRFKLVILIGDSWDWSDGKGWARAEPFVP